MPDADKKVATKPVSRPSALEAVAEPAVPVITRQLPQVSKTIEAKPASQKKVRTPEVSIPEMIPTMPTPINTKSVPSVSQEIKKEIGPFLTAETKLPIPPAPEAKSTASTKNMRSNSVGKTGHESDYSWITGELQKTEGIWVLRYGAEAKDNFGGYVVLFSDVDMRNFKEGDLVSVRGNVINPNARGAQAAHYRAAAVDLIER